MSTYGYLAHHGVKGQKWGIRRFQNPDGSLTAEGKVRYGHNLYSKENRNRLYGSEAMAYSSKKFKDAKEAAVREMGSSRRLTEDEIDEKAYNIVKETDPSSTEALRSYFAYKAEKSINNQARRNIMGLVSTAVIGLGSVQVTNEEAKYYSNKYKEMTNVLLDELEKQDENNKK